MMLEKSKTNSCKCTIIHPADPLGAKVGGAETFIKGLIKYAPDMFDFEYIGVTSKDTIRKKEWLTERLGNKEFKFFPLLYEKDENKKTLIPISLRFTYHLFKSNIEYSNRVLLFNRLEPAILFKNNISPKIVVIHNDIQKQIRYRGSEVLWGKIPSVYFYVENKIFKYMDRIITVNNDTLDFYKSKYPDYRNKYSFMPTWYDTDLFFTSQEDKNMLKRRLSSHFGCLSAKCNWIIYVGRLQEQKAPLRLIDSFYKYYVKNPNTILIVVGEGNLRNSVERHLRMLKITKNVILLGRLEQTILSEYYRASDLLLLTSNYEGMPICVLEALGSGLPVVSTDVGEVNRVVKSRISGEIVKSELPGDISDAIGRVLNNPDVYTKSNCVDSVIEYTPQKILNPFYSLISNLSFRRTE